MWGFKTLVPILQSLSHPFFSFVSQSSLLTVHWLFPGRGFDSIYGPEICVSFFLLTYSAAVYKGGNDTMLKSSSYALLTSSSYLTYFSPHLSSHGFQHNFQAGNSWWFCFKRCFSLNTSRAEVPNLFRTATPFYNSQVTYNAHHFSPCKKDF